MENVSGTTQTWEVELSVDGSMTSLWGASVSESGGVWTFVGESWNASLEPGDATDFGFCAER